jgi:ABC-2 type transport system ATP-binding protein
VDLRGKRNIWEQIRRLRDEGSTILVATNEVREAEYLADRVAVLDRGTCVVCNTVKFLKDSIAGGDIVEIQLDEPVDARLTEALGKLEGTVKVAAVSQNQIKAYVSIAEAWVPKMTSLCYKKNSRVVSVRVTEPSLDDVFLHFTGRALEAAPSE